MNQTYMAGIGTGSLRPPLRCDVRGAPTQMANRFYKVSAPPHMFERRGLPPQMPQFRRTRKYFVGSVLLWGFSVPPHRNNQSAI